MQYWGRKKILLFNIGSFLVTLIIAIHQYLVIKFLKHKNKHCYS